MKKTLLIAGLLGSQMAFAAEQQAVAENVESAVCEKKVFSFKVDDKDISIPVVGKEMSYFKDIVQIPYTDSTGKVDFYWTGVKGFILCTGENNYDFYIERSKKTGDTMIQFNGIKLNPPELSYSSRFTHFDFTGLDESQQKEMIELSLVDKNSVLIGRSYFKK